MVEKDNVHNQTDSASTEGGDSRKRGLGMQFKSRRIRIGLAIVFVALMVIFTVIYNSSFVSMKDNQHFETAPQVSAGESQDDAGEEEEKTSQSGWEDPIDFSASDWVFNMWDDLAVWTGNGDYVAWGEAKDKKVWDFKIALPDGSYRCYVFAAEYKKQATDAGVSVAACEYIDYMNGKLAPDGDEPFVEAKGTEAVAFSAEDEGSVAVPYADTELLHSFANLAKFYAASMKKSSSASSEDDELNEYGFYDWEMKDIVITPDGEAVNKGQVNVYFRPSAPEGYFKRITSEFDLAIDYEFEPESKGQYKGCIWVAFTFDDGRAEWDVRDKIAEQPYVAKVWLNPAGHMNTSPSKSTVAKLPSFPWNRDLQYYLKYSGFERAWNKAKCDKTVSVGIIDTGIDYENAELEANIDVVNMANVTDSSVSIGVGEHMYDTVENQGSPHGTQVAGVVSAVAGDEAGCDGASYNAEVIPVKYTYNDGGNSEACMTEAYRYLLELENPPSVINISSAKGFDNYKAAINDKETAKLQALIKQGWKKGIVTVASAGNDGATTNSYNVPACLDNVVSVGALNAPGLFEIPTRTNPSLCDFSNTRSSVDICAYGENILTVNANPGFFGDHVAVDGTSFSAPLASSAAALLKAEHPDWSAAEIVDRLKCTAQPMSDNGCGAGALDAEAAFYRESPNTGIEDLFPKTHANEKGRALQAAIGEGQSE